MTGITLQSLLRNLDETYALCRVLAEELQRCSALRTLLLHGPLGSGKTTFTAGLVRALPNGNQAETGSPSFTLCNYYPTLPPVMHCDMYRSNGTVPDEILDGLENCAMLTVVEWAEYLPQSDLPNEFLDISFEPCKNSRLLTMRSHGHNADGMLRTLLNSGYHWTQL